MNEETFGLVFKSMSKNKKRRFIRSMAKEQNGEVAFIREFAIVDGSKFKHPVPSVVFHVTTGLWRAYDMEFAELVEAMNVNPKRDEELLQDIYNLD